MSASPEHQVDNRVDSLDRVEDDKVVTPIAAEDEGDKSTDPIAEPEDAPEVDAENKDDLVGEDDADNDAELSDDESILSEVDEAQFENFDPENVDVDDRPQLAIDEENLKLIGRHKRKRADGEEGRSRRKEGRREKKSRRGRDEDEGEEGSSRRRERKKAASPDTDEETLDPETRRRRALDRAMDEAMKKPTKRRARKQDGIVRYYAAHHNCACTDCLGRISRLWPMLRLRICVSE